MEIGVLVKSRLAPLSAVAPVKVFAVVTPPGGPIVIDEPVAVIELPVPVARNPICPLAVAVVVAVVLSVLPSKMIMPPDYASPPVVVAAARLSVIPLAVICPPAPEALSPTAPAGVTVMIVPGVTVHAVPTTTAGLGHTCAKAGDANPAPACRAAAAIIIRRMRSV
jgi:hypothetical protein